jgi:hypothetical protein
MRKSLIISAVSASTFFLSACGDPKPPATETNAAEEIVAPSENAGMAAGDGAMSNAADANMAAPVDNGQAGTEPAGAGSNGGPVIKKP